MKKMLLTGAALAALFLGMPAHAELKFKPGEDQRFHWANFDELKKLATEDARLGSVVMKLSLDAAVARLKADLGGASELTYTTTIKSLEMKNGEAHVQTTSRMSMTWCHLAWS